MKKGSIVPYVNSGTNRKARGAGELEGWGNRRTFKKLTRGFGGASLLCPLGFLPGSGPPFGALETGASKKKNRLNQRRFVLSRCVLLRVALKTI